MPHLPFRQSQWISRFRDGAAAGFVLSLCASLLIIAISSKVTASETQEKTEWLPKSDARVMSLRNGQFVIHVPVSEREQPEIISPMDGPMDAALQRFDMATEERVWAAMNEFLEVHPDQTILGTRERYSHVIAGGRLSGAVTVLSHVTIFTVPTRSIHK